jgi:hypothetical protein
MLNEQVDAQRRARRRRALERVFFSSQLIFSPFAFHLLVRDSRKSLGKRHALRPPELDFLDDVKTWRSS